MATLTALAASLILYVALFSSSTPAYALEQTAQANDRITSYHVKVTPAPLDQMGEAWIQLNPGRQSPSGEGGDFLSRRRPKGEHRVERQG